MSWTCDDHLVFIDFFREDFLMSRARDWLDEFITKLADDEIKRNRNKLLEINHFLDIQKEEFADVTVEDHTVVDVDPLDSLM